MKLVLGCSMKHRGLVRDVVARLNAAGVAAMFPNLDYSDDDRDATPSAGEKERLAREHYAAIDAADAVYFIVPDGYMGTSCKTELGYAFAKGKAVYFSEPTGDPSLDWYAKDFVPTDQIQKFGQTSPQQSKEEVRG